MIECDCGAVQYSNMRPLVHEPGCKEGVVLLKWSVIDQHRNDEDWEEMAEALTREMIRVLGMGYHPDDVAKDYVNVKTGEHVFSRNEARVIDDAFDLLWVEHEVDYAALGLEIMRELHPDFFDTDQGIA